MGLFNWGKKRVSVKSPREFYSDCVTELHKEATQYGVANQGLIFIPELIPIGEKTVLAFLQDNFYQAEFGKNPQMYYYAIMTLSLQAGIDFATKWHENFSELNFYANRILQVGPADDANALLKQYFSNEISQNQGNPFYQKIYAKWLELHEPYWKMQDPREYTFRLMIAAYQLGVSMILEKFGYGTNASNETNNQIVSAANLKEQKALVRQFFNSVVNDNDLQSFVDKKEDSFNFINQLSYIGKIRDFVAKEFQNANDQKRKAEYIITTFYATMCWMWKYNGGGSCYSYSEIDTWVDLSKADFIIDKMVGKRIGDEIWAIISKFTDLVYQNLMKKSIALDKNLVDFIIAYAGSLGGAVSLKYRYEFEKQRENAEKRTAEDTAKGQEKAMNVVKDILENGFEERIKELLTFSSSYSNGKYSKYYPSNDEIIRHFKFVNCHIKNIRVEKATVVGTSKEIEEMKQYVSEDRRYPRGPNYDLFKMGAQCLAVYYNDTLESLIFFDMYSDGQIYYLYETNDHGYVVQNNSTKEKVRCTEKREYDSYFAKEPRTSVVF